MAFPRALLVCLVCSLPFNAGAAPLVSPSLHLHPAGNAAPRVALTFDACSGSTDERILRALVDNRIKATIFATAGWLKRNGATVEILNAHPDLFEIENHGARHLVAIDWPTRVFGVKAAGSPDALREEITAGAKAVEAATGRIPHWYRGATAEYSKGAEAIIADMHYRLAGFSLLGDGGAQYSSARTAKIIANAADGDVIIAHINQPGRPAGAGVVAGILALKAKGFEFVTLEDGVPPAPHHPRMHVGH